MKCPFCGYLEDKVIDSRTGKEGASIRRRRECLKCTKRFTTYEKIEIAPTMVVKRDGRREPFDRAKVRERVQLALAKRPVGMEAVDRLLDEVEQELNTGIEREVLSVKVGAIVMEKLRKLDEVAYVRFASVYRYFKDISEFRVEVEQLESSKSGETSGGEE